MRGARDDDPAAGRAIRWLVIGALAAATVFGAAQLAFLCDDALITFRYVANAHAGLGLVWNPAPFRPVEGFTGFLWALMLWATWSWFGVTPPAAANVLSIACGLGQVAVVARIALRLRRRDGRRLPDLVGLLALAAVVGNRTFLQWLTSGLETSLFNLTFLAWVVLAFRPAERRTAGWLGLWSATAAAAALTRPDGLLLVAATGTAAVLMALQGTLRARQVWSGLAPLLAVLAHLVWRRWFYGEWLPNTYYAKVVAPWPEAGLRYFACFALENGAWLWFPVTLVWLVTELRHGGLAAVASLRRHLPAVAAVGATLSGALYYLILVGGDHFEYRVLSQLVPLGVLGCAAMAGRIGTGVRLPVLTVVAIGLASTLGWFHLALTGNPSLLGTRAVTPHVPAAVRPLARWFDKQQAWLFFRYIGMRCTFHRNNLDNYRTNFPSFPEQLRIVDAPDPFPALATGAVGLPAWSLPDCAIIDIFGLNDWVVARTPAPAVEPMPADRLRPAVERADRDADGFLGPQELADALGFGDITTRDDTRFVIEFLVATYGDQRPGVVSLAEAVSMGDVLDYRRLMAHERLPPAGYAEAFEPNVVMEHGRPVVHARPQPMTAERIRAIETEWRERVRRGEVSR